MLLNDILVNMLNVLVSFFSFLIFKISVNQKLPGINLNSILIRYIDFRFSSYMSVSFCRHYTFIHILLSCPRIPPWDVKRGTILCVRWLFLRLNHLLFDRRFSQLTRMVFSRPYPPTPSRLFLQITGAKSKPSGTRLTILKYVFISRSGFLTLTFFLDLYFDFEI